MSVIGELRKLKHSNPDMLKPFNRQRLCSELRARGYTVFEDTIRKETSEILKNNEIDNKIYQAKVEGMFPESELNKLLK